MRVQERDPAPEGLASVADEGTGHTGDPRQERRVRPHLLSVRAAGIAGILFAALVTASIALLSRSYGTDPEGDLVAWFTENVSPTATVVTLYLIPFAGIAFLWFMAGLRDSAAWREDRLFDTVLLGSGLLFVAMMFASAATTAALVARVSESADYALSGDNVRLARLMSFSFFNVFAARAAGVFVMVSSAIFLRTRLMPRWIGLVGIALALVLLLGISFLRFVIYLFPAWAVLVSVAILVLFRQGAGREGAREDGVRT
jgi:hypothetical protein